MRNAGKKKLFFPVIPLAKVGGRKSEGKHANRKNADERDYNKKSHQHPAYMKILIEVKP